MRGTIFCCLFWCVCYVFVNSFKIIYRKAREDEKLPHFLLPKIILASKSASYMSSNTFRSDKFLLKKFSDPGFRTLNLIYPFSFHFFSFHFCPTDLLETKHFIGLALQWVCQKTFVLRGSFPHPHFEKQVEVIIYVLSMFYGVWKDDEIVSERVMR